MAIIEVTGLRKVYGGRAVVDEVSFAVEEGEIFGVLGPNGAGKTTTVECVEGLRVPDGGTVRVGGLDPVADHDRVTRILGSQLQESELQAKLTVQEALELYSACYPRPADWRQLVERLGLTDRLTARFGKLSGGQKQRLFIALALIGNPRVVVLDELTTGLDPRARRDTWQLIEEIRDSGVTVAAGHPFHGGGPAAVRPDRGDRPRPGRRAGQPGGSDQQGLAVRRHLLHAVGAARPRRTGGAAAARVRGTERPDRRTEPAGSAGERLVIHGTDATVDAVISLLARHRITARQLRVGDATLDDAFLDLTAQEA